jgi:hypothetical protein
MTDKDQPATQRALATVYAVKHRHVWGFYAARRYAELRGCTPLMWMTTLRIECDRALRTFPFTVPLSRKL